MSPEFTLTGLGIDVLALAPSASEGLRQPEVAQAVGPQHAYPSMDSRTMKRLSLDIWFKFLPTGTPIQYVTEEMSTPCLIKKGGNPAFP